MTRQEYIEYWKVAAEKDWVVVQNLFDKTNYPHALFFAHLVLEKLLKAHFEKTTQAIIHPESITWFVWQVKPNLFCPPMTCSF